MSCISYSDFVIQNNTNNHYYYVTVIHIRFLQRKLKTQTQESKILRIELLKIDVLDLILRIMVLLPDVSWLTH